MNGRLISLAAGIMPEATPAQLIEAAAASDFDFGGMWAERETILAKSPQKVYLAPSLFCQR